MKFGIYSTPDTNMAFRCIDGHFDRIHLPEYTTPIAMWEGILKAPSAPCNQEIVKAKLANCGSLSTYTRSVAKCLYGVPDDVELYQPGDFGVGY